MTLQPLSYHLKFIRITTYLQISREFCFWFEHHPDETSTIKVIKKQTLITVVFLKKVQELFS